MRLRGRKSPRTEGSVVFEWNGEQHTLRPGDVLDLNITLHSESRSDSTLQVITPVTLTGRTSLRVVAVVPEVRQ